MTDEPLYLYSTRDVADRLGVSPQTVRTWIVDGPLGHGPRGGAFLAGSRWRITSDAVVDFVNTATAERLEPPRQDLKLEVPSALAVGAAPRERGRPVRWASGPPAHH